MKDNILTTSDAEFSELFQLATQCSEESSSISTTPDATPTTTPSSTPPSRRKRRQRTKSPTKEKSSTINFPVGGGAGGTGATKGKSLFISEEKVTEQQLQIISIPLTTVWNNEVVYMVDQTPEAQVSEYFIIPNN